MKVVHVIPRLLHGGAARSTIDFARELMHCHQVESILVCLGASHPGAVAWARDAGLPVILPDAPDESARAVRDADLVHLAFWNTPETYVWLRSPLPPMRLLVTLHVMGEFPAQITPPPLLRFADWLIPTCARTASLPAFRETLQTRAERVTVIPGTLDLHETPPRADLPPPLRVGYIGSVDMVKMHPRFLELCAAIKHDYTLFPVGGSGNALMLLMRRAEQLNLASKFQWLGYLKQPAAVFAGLDVFGYPLSPKTSATVDLVLQEAMWHGVPPVILPFGALSELVRHDETGLIVSEAEYPNAIDELLTNRAKRKQLGENARAYARSHFGVRRLAPSLLAVYEQAMKYAKTARVWSGDFLAPAFPGASALIESFGSSDTPYRASLQGGDAALVHAADQEIACATPVETDASAGGVLDYRRFYPNDPFLRLWSGLVLAREGRFALAAGELTAARRLGLPAERVSRYLERVAQHKTLFQDVPA